MSSVANFNHISFQRKVNNALTAVERTLELERSPRLAEEVDHTYGAKYELVDTTTNAAIIAYMTCLEKLGLNGLILGAIVEGAGNKPLTLRFDVSTTPTFVKEVRVKVPMEYSYEQTEETAGSKITKVLKAVRRVTKFHYDVELEWSLSIYSGTSVDERTVLRSNKSSSVIHKQTKESSRLRITPQSYELPLTWLLKQVNLDDMASQFKVDTSRESTKTPRRNDDVDKAIEFSSRLNSWVGQIQTGLYESLARIEGQHDPGLVKDPVFSRSSYMDVLRSPVDPTFNPILPLMEDRPELSSEPEDEVVPGSLIKINMQSHDDNADRKALLLHSDLTKLTNEHARSLQGVLETRAGAFVASDEGIIATTTEIELAVVLRNLQGLSIQYEETMNYVESMMERQLIAAIGKRLTQDDLQTYVRYHDARLLSPAPKPFSLAIRRPEHYPTGLVSIETMGGENDCIHSHSRQVNVGSTITVALNSATQVQLSGNQYLHGWMNHRFGNDKKNHQLVARARQFSAFILVIGTMVDGTTLGPDDAIIVQNKDELLIPLLLEEIPTAREFKDAIKSLSPEQQRFAQSYRSMQLSSSMFGLCVVQIKPQLEALLGLPADALDKEMKLTQDLMKLFIEYQVPSDLLSYNGHSESAALEDKIGNVKANVKAVVDVVELQKEQQLKDERAKSDMAMMMRCDGNMRCSGRAKSDMATMGMERGGSYTRCSGGITSWKGKQRLPTENVTSQSRMRGCAPRQQLPVFLYSDGADDCDSFSLGDYDVASAGTISIGEPIEESQEYECAALGSESQRNVGGKVTTSSRSDRGDSVTQQGVDFTLIPKKLDQSVEKRGDAASLHSTTIKTSSNWTRNRQANLLSKPERHGLDADEIRKEKSKAFDLLDALSRSGSLAIAHSELHVVVAMTHCFEKDLMGTVICDNVNPIEKLEGSTLLLASAVHGLPLRELVRDVSELQRLGMTMPCLLEG
ncbi:hypothetical protein THAOC_31512 [Thalassiosira oceanica]|uniref:Uncharacterized protein n=1 Tax=Thalassiosira oceanica TaxID=159749 RepID=K0R7Z3_THAOC|nr:hypothetical protein THAOC_31512 [Thalassiosira oceanica]|eukprot:EJK49598.1 hypothetical protein THAOC_31512 [Thalassiosira oceanica]